MGRLTSCLHILFLGASWAWSRQGSAIIRGNGGFLRFLVAPLPFGGVMQQSGVRVGPAQDECDGR